MNDKASFLCRSFTSSHALVCLFYFLLVILVTVLTFHPVLLLLSATGACLLYLSLAGRKGVRTLLCLSPFLLLTLILNPFLNTAGDTVLFSYFGRSFTLEALLYGISVALMLFSTLLWAFSFQIVLGDRLISVLAPLAPSFSLLLVMVLRLIPAFFRKARQIRSVRGCIGKGDDQGVLAGIHSGFANLSALTGWALEGSVITADSMKARGYGSGKRSSFLTEHFALQDGLSLLFLLVSGSFLLVGIAAGWLNAALIPRIEIDYGSAGLWIECFFFLILSLFPFLLQLFHLIQNAQN